MAGVGAGREVVWLCKICAEEREMWKKSGAWFFKVGWVRLGGWVVGGNRPTNLFGKHLWENSQFWIPDVMVGKWWTSCFSS